MLLFFIRDGIVILSPLELKPSIKLDGSELHYLYQFVIALIVEVYLVLGPLMRSFLMYNVDTAST